MTIARPGHDRDAAADGRSATLASALAQIQLSGAIFLHSEYTEAWAYESMASQDVAAVLAPDAARIVIFHVVLSGSCWIEAGMDKVWAHEGDVIVLPYNDQHRMGGHEAAEPVPISQLIDPPPWNELPHIVHGLGGARSELVCGFLACDDRLFDPRMAVFPPVFVVTPPEGPVRSWVKASSSLVLQQASQATDDRNAAPTDIPQLLLREVLKLHLANAPATDTGWLAALRDPVVAPALAAIHGDPSRKWALADLAREATVSSTGLDERFRTVLGLAPIRYLTGWRMHVAEDLLRTTSLPVAGIARRVGTSRMKHSAAPSSATTGQRRAAGASRSNDVVTSSGPSERVIAIPREIWILVGAAFVISLGYGIVSPVLPAYARSFDVGVAAASVIVSAFAFFRLVFAPVGGELVSRLGERPVYVTGLLIVAASSFATAFAGSYVQLLIFRGLGGIGSTMFTISAMALLVRLAPPRARGGVSSTYGSAFLIGGMIGPVLGGLLAGLGLRAPFLIYGVALLVAAAVVAVGLGHAGLQPVEERATRDVLPLAEAWQSPVYRAVLVSGVANGWTNFGVRLAVLPLLATAVLDQPWVAGAALAIGAVGTAATLPVSGRLADRIGRRPLIIRGLVVMGAAMGLLALSDQPALPVWVGLAVLFGLSLISGVGAGLVSPAQQATIADVIGHERNGGRVLSTFQMAQDGGAIVGPILVGMVADRLGFPAAFVVTGLVCLVGAVPWLTAPEPLVHHAAPLEK